MRKRPIMALVVAALVALAWPATAPAQRDRQDCFDHLGRGARIVDETRFGIVFRRSNYVYACIYSVGRVRRLPLQDPLGPPETLVGVLRLDGRYVGYSLEDEEGGAQVVLFDAKTGTRRWVASVFGPEASGDPNVTRYSLGVRSIVVKANGQTAWIAQGSRKVGEEPVPGGTRDVLEPVVEVVLRGPNDTANRTLDSGGDIGPRSLAKSADEQTLFWTRGGAARSAPLP